MTLTVPGGKTSLRRSTMASVTKGVYGLGLITTVLPQIRGDEIFPHAITARTKPQVRCGDHLLA